MHMLPCNLPFFVPNCNYDLIQPLAENAFVRIWYFCEYF